MLQVVYGGHNATQYDAQSPANQIQAQHWLGRSRYVANGVAAILIDSWLPASLKLFIINTAKNETMLKTIMYLFLH